MPDLKGYRQDRCATGPEDPCPASTESPPEASNPRRFSVGSWLRSTADTVALSFSRKPMVDLFVETAAKATEPEEVRVELVRLAWGLSGAARVELYSDREGRAARRLACWPPAFPIETSTESRSNLRGPISGVIARSTKEQQGPLTLQIPLKAGESSFGILRLVASDRRPWPAWLVRRLETLCAVASTAERGLCRTSGGNSDPAQGPHGSEILSAFLTFAQAQARRRHESLSLLEVAVDRLDSIKELLGDELAEAAVERVSRAIKSTIRASDIVARLGSGRIAVLLPNATPENALRVAEAVRLAIARAGAGSTTMPCLTASIGLATYPDHAHDVATLLAAACSALTQAREQGQDQILIAPPLSGTQVYPTANCVGWNS